MTDETFFAELAEFVARRGYELDLSPDSNLLIPVKGQAATELNIPLLLLENA